MPEFYNEADHIDYPFVAGFSRLHSGSGVFDGQGFLDFSLTVGPDTNFSEATNTVTWTGFSIGATDVIFVFSVQGVGLINFVVPLNSPYGFVTTAEIIIGDVVATGLLVTADLAYFSSLALGVYTMDVPPRIEPTLITSLRGAFVTMITAANARRRRPLECCDEVNFGPLPPTPAVPPVFSVNVFPLSGDIITLKEGFNCFIAMTESNNTLTIGSRLGAGAGEDDGSDPFLIDNWPFQSLTPYKCCDFITSINGVPVVSDTFKILTQGGVVLTSDIPTNTINAVVSNRGVVCP